MCKAVSSDYRYVVELLLIFIFFTLFLYLLYLVQCTHLSFTTVPLRMLQNATDWED